MITYGTHTSAEDLEKRALSGPHRGWTTFDIGNEGSKIQLLHEAVQMVPFPKDVATGLLESLRAFAGSAGYADADSCLYAISCGTDETLNAIHHASVFDDHEENDYFAEVRNSERLIFAVAATKEARSFLGDTGQPGWNGTRGTIYRVMLAEYENGRDMKAAEDKLAEASPASFMSPGMA